MRGRIPKTGPQNSAVAILPGDQSTSPYTRAQETHAGQKPSANCHVLLYIVPMSKTSKTKARVLSTRTAFRGKVFFVTSDEVQEPSHIRARRDVVRHPGSVVVLAVDESRPEARVLLEYQYRYAADQFLWELPAGRVDRGETELVAAKRELLEETGYKAKRWELALKYYASPGFTDETMAIYLARDLCSGKAQPENDEAIRTRFLPLSAVEHKIMSGKIRDGKTIAGVLWFQKYMAQKPA
jgi:ADP-ribose pyrophosphatase